MQKKIIIIRANGNFKVAPDGNSEGLKDPFPSVVYNSIYGGEEANYKKKRESVEKIISLVCVKNT